MENRPTGRQKRVTEGGKGVHKTGEGLGGGPVGRSDGYAGRKEQYASSGSGGNRVGAPGGGARGGSGGSKSPLGLIIILAVILFGGGGGLFSLLGGSGDSSTGSGSGQTTYSYSGGTGSHTGTSGSTVNNGASGTGGSQAGTYSSSAQSGTQSQQSSAGGTLSEEKPSSGYISGYNFGDLFSGTYSGSSVDYSQGSASGEYQSSGIDLSSLSSLFGGGISSSATGTFGSWTNAANTGILNTTVAAGTREKYTRLIGNGRDVVTLMIYMCGTDLESGSGMATSDLMEMTKASISDNVNVLVYTGGCKRWRNEVISSSRNQIYRVQSGGLERLVEDDGDRSMTDPATLTRFINWCAKYYPANRNELIFWDHGGGSASGYGYDQKHSREGAMSLASIRKAIGDTGLKFDFIGFDACLMATAENALGLSQYADYMIASEETEPGIGWYYTNWLTQFSQNTSASTLSIGQKIIDDYMQMCGSKCRGQSTTLSMVDLAELSATLPGAFSNFSQDTGELIAEESYGKIATARSQTREFARSTGINQVDLTDLAYRVGTEEGTALAEAIISAVKYNRTSSDMSNSFGLSIYFPNKNISKVSSMVQTYKEVGLDPECMVKFATVQASGQTVSGGSHSAYDSLGGGSAYGSSSYGSSELGSLIESLFGGSSYGSSSYGSGSSYGSSSYGGSSYGSGSSYGGSAYGSSTYGGGSYGNSYGGSSSGGTTYDNYSGGDFTSEYSLMDLMGLLLGGGSGRSLGGESTDLSFVEESGLSEERLFQIVESNHFDAGALTWTDNAVNHTLHLSENQWSQVQRLQVNLFFDDGEGYVDLGMDDTCSFTAEGDLVGETDRTWLSIDGQPVAYYNIGTFQDGDASVTMGRVPCMLNGETVNLLIVFDSEHPYGFIAGVRTDYREGETDTLAKAQDAPKDGDELRFLCDYYSYDGTFLDRYQLGNPMIVSGEPEISNTDVGEGGAVVTYCFTDLFGQEYWTPAIVQ